MSKYEILLIYKNENDDWADRRTLIATTENMESHKNEAHYQLDKLFEDLKRWMKSKKEQK